MARIRNPGWKEDRELQEFLVSRIERNYQRKARKQFPDNAWRCMRTLASRLSFFNISYIDPDAGNRLGIRAMQLKVRETHKQLVPRNLIWDVMTDVAPEGLAERGGVGVKKN